jgi:hypothetical protein
MSEEDAINEVAVTVWDECGVVSTVYMQEMADDAEESGNPDGTYPCSVEDEERETRKARGRERL